MPAAASFSAYLRVLFQKVGTLATPQVDLILNLAGGLTDGIADTALDKAWGEYRSTATTDDIDLNGATIKDAFGDNLAFLEVCGVFVSTPASNPGNIIVGAAAALGTTLASGGVTHTRILKPGSFDFWFSPAGWPVVAGTSDVLRFASSAGTNFYSAIVIGRSA